MAAAQSVREAALRALMAGGGQAALELTLRDGEMQPRDRALFTQLVNGKSRANRWRDAFGRSLASALMREAHGGALHVVTEKSSEPA